VEEESFGKRGRFPCTFRHDMLSTEYCEQGSAVRTYCKGKDREKIGT